MCKSNAPALATTALMVQIVRRAAGNSHNHGLSDAQWFALDYFGKANRFSRTLPGFAKYHATSLASASQTISSLCKRGLLKRSIDESDRRRAWFDLTAAGQELFEKEGFDQLGTRISDLTGAEIQNLETILASIIDHLDGRIQEGPVKTCHSCDIYRESQAENGGKVPFFCSRFKSEIHEDDMQGLCMSAKTKLPRAKRVKPARELDVPQD